MTDTVKRGRKEIFAKPELMKRALREIRNGTKPEGKPTATYFLTRRLADAGLVEFVAVRGEGRGRPRKVATVTREGELAIATA
jgi:DNA-binding PadR family transcriptional regulator